MVHVPSQSSQAPHLLKAELDEKAGEVTNFKFTIPWGNPGYDEIYDLITLVKVTKIDTQEVIFEGRVFNSIKDLNEDGQVYTEVQAESELIYLNDSLVGIWDIEGMGVSDFFQKVINNHNQQVGTLGDKQFQLGRIEVTGSITVKTNRENSLNSLINNCPNVLGGYISCRKENGIRYLDYLPNLNGQSADIVLAKNMKGVSFSKDVTNIATRAFPIGKDSLDITSVNNGIDYIDNIEAQQKYGVISQTLEFKDITDPTTLLNAAKAKLDDIAKPTYKLSTTVLDTSLIGLDAQSFYCGTDVRISCPVLGFDENFTIIEKVTDLLNPQNAKLTINDKFGTDTDRQIALQRTANILNGMLTSDNNLNGLYLANVVDLLKCRMKAMADSAEKQEAKAILFEDKIPNSPTYGAMALGTQGFMIASEIKNGDWDWKTFGTGAGFTADLIIAGTLLADRIAGGTLSSKDGSLKINLDSGHFTFLNNALKALDLYNNTIDFHDWSNNGNIIGSISSTHNNITGKSGVSLGVKNGCLLNVGTMTINTDGTYIFNPLVEVDYTGSAAKMNLYNDIHVQGNLFNSDNDQGENVTITLSDGFKMDFKNGLLVKSGNY